MTISRPTMNSPPEIEEPPDQWEVDQEAADWLGNNEQQIQTAPTSTLPNPNANSDIQLNSHKSASESPFWGKPSDLHGSERMEENDSGGEEDQERQNNTRLYHQLVEQIPGYAWRVEDANEESMDVIYFPSHKEKLKCKRRGVQLIKGKGTDNVSLQYPRYYSEPVRRWFNKLLWHPRAPGPNNPRATVTLPECVVDFELSIGLCLGSISGETLTLAQTA